ncbi:antigen 5-related 2 salivary protein [Anopheles sinensis]|uniref:Antigen 5-related 2 salivary protein n=1 Tax=Anopheles sinensis TaxID=74873 RepID=A0A084VUC6_ANOSI|nr:antigen 5-related 2 salivary protein [Anopheles sinensis]
MAKILPLDQANIVFILAFLNTVRNEAAFGNIQEFSGAARMRMLTWDDELAAQAANKAHTCEYSFDACRNTAKYPNVGQIVAKYTPTNPSDKSGTISDFFYGIKLISDVQTASINDWGNFLSDQAVAVGCAAMEFTEDGSLVQLWVCNISAATTVGERIYVSGSGGNGCTSGTDETYAGLCSASEPI